MKTSQGCKPCLFKNATSLLDDLVKDDVLKRTLEDKITKYLIDADCSNTPPVLYNGIIDKILQNTNTIDPYKDEKVKQNILALSLEPYMRERVEKAEDSFSEAVKISIAGNSIDLGVYGKSSNKEIKDRIDESLEHELDTKTIESLRFAIDEASNIVFIGDNAGEIVFDKILIEALDPSKVTYIVRGNPVLNDATLDDAVQVGMDKIVKIVDNGSSYPGTVLDKCSKEFISLFRNADLVISKGQGNYETLNESQKRIFHLFKVKCDVIAEHCDKPVGTLAIID